MNKNTTLDIMRNTAYTYRLLSMLVYVFEATHTFATPTDLRNALGDYEDTQGKRLTNRLKDLCNGGILKKRKRGQYVFEHTYKHSITATAFKNLKRNAYAHPDLNQNNMVCIVAKMLPNKSALIKNALKKFLGHSTDSATVRKMYDAVLLQMTYSDLTPQEQQIDSELVIMLYLLNNSSHKLESSRHLYGVYQAFHTASIDENIKRLSEANFLNVDAGWGDGWGKITINNPDRLKAYVQSIWERDYPSKIPEYFVSALKLLTKYQRKSPIHITPLENVYTDIIEDIDWFIPSKKGFIQLTHDALSLEEVAEEKEENMESIVNNNAVDNETDVAILNGKNTMIERLRQLRESMDEKQDLVTRLQEQLDEANAELKEASDELWWLRDEIYNKAIAELDYALFDITNIEP